MSPINPFSGEHRFWTPVNHHTDPHLRLPDCYGRMWLNIPQQERKCVCITTGDGEVSQIQIVRWGGCIYLAKGWPEFYCQAGLKVNDVLVFSFNEIASLNIAILSLGGAESSLNRGIVGQNSFGVSINKKTRCEIALPHEAVTGSYILELPFDFATSSLEFGSNEIVLNLEGDTTVKILCVLGPLRAIATTGWAQFVNKAKLRVGETVILFKNPGINNMWNTKLPAGNRMNMLETRTKRTPVSQGINVESFETRLGQSSNYSIDDKTGWIVPGDLIEASSPTVTKSNNFIGEIESQEGPKQQPFPTNCGVPGHFEELPIDLARHVLKQGRTSITFQIKEKGAWAIICNLRGSSCKIETGWHEFAWANELDGTDTLVFCRDGASENVWCVAKRSHVHRFY